MITTEAEDQVVEKFRRLEGQTCRENVLHYLDTMIRAQEALKADYGLTEPAEQKEVQHDA
jgi:hypothetical protein